MNKTLIIATTAVVAGGLTVAAAKKWDEYMEDLQNRFPDLDKKIIRKAYLRELWNSFNGAYGDIENFTDEQMDVLFLAEVEKITNKK